MLAAAPANAGGSAIRASAFRHSSFELRHSLSARRAFTLVELLVVITIIGSLVAMLLPALGQAKERAKVINCGSRQRGMGSALATYAADYREYPTNFPNSDTDYSWNHNDECAGRWYEGASNYSGAHPNLTDAYPGVSGSTGAWARLAVGQYVPSMIIANALTATGISLCTSERKISGAYFMTGQWYQTAAGSLFTYNGPLCFRDAVANNGALNGLYRMGRHDVGVDWGVRYNSMAPGFSPSDIAFLGCPSIYWYFDDAGNYVPTGRVFEPHGTQPVTYGGGQGDNYGNPENFQFDRNFLYADMHVKYLHSDTRAGIP
jgi:prepilin-type N-terminal cleavage/methylation domain-containing protein